MSPAVNITSSKLVWMREQLARSSTPYGCMAEMIGTYDPILRTKTIYMMLTINGTEYRVIKCHEQVLLKTNDETSELRLLHRNMISHISRNYGTMDWSVIVKKFLLWSTNPIYTSIVSQWIND